MDHWLAKLSSNAGILSGDGASVLQADCEPFSWPAGVEIRRFQYTGTVLTAKKDLRRSVGRIGSALGFLFITAISVVSNVSPARTETLGFVLTEWHHAGQFTSDGRVECPNGFSPGYRDNFRAQYKQTQNAQQETNEVLANNALSRRGPHGESDKYNPDLVEDPLPFQEGQGSVSPGLDLDGTKDGHSTDETCAHGKFTSPEGEVGIDNQLYRVLACIAGLRPGGVSDGLTNNEVVTKGLNRWLVEVTDVDDEANDDHVDVMVAHGLDKLARDANGKFIPGLSQRVDEDASAYIFHTTGRIMDHVLTTDAIPGLGIGQTGVLEHGVLPFLYGRLKLKLTPDGATGVLAGYHDVEKFYRFWAKTTGIHDVIANASPPSVYAALHRLADGYKDPASGKCTAISAVYDMQFVRAFIVHSPAAAEVSENASAQSDARAAK